MPYFVATLAALLVIPLLNVRAAETAGRVFKDCATCPAMVVIPGGTFLMGSVEKAPGEKGWPPNPDEFPQHRVTIATFALGKVEVTQEQWFAFMGDYPSFNRGSTLPVETVSWDEAQVFVARLSAKTGQQYRLPTEAEWEYAARAGSTTAFSFGDDPAQLDRYAWFSDNSGKKAHPVGEKAPNAFGLHDMHGNVWEWVQDCYRPSYVDAPTDGRAVPEERSCNRVIRDGSGVDFPKSLRVAERYSNQSDYRNGKPWSPRCPDAALVVTEKGLR